MYIYIYILAQYLTVAMTITSTSRVRALGVIRLSDAGFRAPHPQGDLA